ncbi:MAG: site-specific DNA-methyltransferase [Thermoplasmata archaeon]|jgi:site-specific DNA-methyltransferase (adenine-specific)
MPPSRPFARLPLEGGGAVTLWCEDAIAGLPRRLPAHGADVVVTSPPYNRKVPYSSYSDDRPRAEYLAWIGELRDAVDAVLAPGGSYFLNVGGAPSDPFLPLDVARETARKFVLQNVIHWVKSIAIDRAAAGRAAALDRDLALGHYRPMASDRYVHGAHEYVFHFSRRGDVPLDRLAIGVPYQDKSNVARWGGRGADVRCRGNTWFLPYPTIRFRARDRPHPASFPPELPEWCLRLHGLARVHLAVDPFVGIGSSAVAAVRLGVPFVGFDVDREYLAVAAERVRAERGGARSPIPRSGGRRSRAGSRSASASG